MLNRRPKTQGTSRLVRVQSIDAYGCQDDRTSFYPLSTAQGCQEAGSLSTVPTWEIHRATCRCPYCV